jgi:hypothetical protein
MRVVRGRAVDVSVGKKLGKGCGREEMVFGAGFHMGLHCSIKDAGDMKGED